MAALPLAKDADHIAPAAGADVTSGCQLAASGSVIGVLSETPGEQAPGQSIGLDADSTFFTSI